MLRRVIKYHFPDNTVSILRKLRNRVLGSYYRKNLTQLAELHGSDKWGKHFYTPHYKHHFNPFRQKSINILEIGVGGNKSPTYGGASLRMWKDYFRKGQIYGIDIHDKSALEERRIKTFKGSQADEIFLKEVIARTGKLDIIIDDGSHVNEHIITSFKSLFPHLNRGGIYVIEDTQTSYWNFFGGNSEDMNDPKTAMGFFKSLTDGLNHREYLKPGYKLSYFDKNITSIHFYHNLIFIYKGENSEPSSYLVKNEIPRG